PRANHGVTHAPAIVVVDLHAPHLAARRSVVAKSSTWPSAIQAGRGLSHNVTAAPPNACVARDKGTARDCTVAGRGAGAKPTAERARARSSAGRPARSGVRALRHDQPDAQRHPVVPLGRTTTRPEEGGAVLY